MILALLIFSDTRLNIWFHYHSVSDLLWNLSRLVFATCEANVHRKNTFHPDHKELIRSSVYMAMGRYRWSAVYTTPLNQMKSSPNLIRRVSFIWSSHMRHFCSGWAVIHINSGIHNIAALWKNKTGVHCVSHFFVISWFESTERHRNKATYMGWGLLFIVCWSLNQKEFAALSGLWHSFLFLIYFFYKLILHHPPWLSRTNHNHLAMTLRKPR